MESWLAMKSCWTGGQEDGIWVEEDGRIEWRAQRAPNREDGRWVTQPHLRRKRRGRCFSPEELRNGHQRADALGMDYKLELWQTANSVGPFRGGGNPKALEQLLTSLTVDLRRAGGRSHILHPCLSLPHILPDLSSPPLHLPKGLGTLAAALWSKPPVASSCTTVLDSSRTGALHPGCLPSAPQPRLSRPGPFSQCQVHLAEKGQRWLSPTLNSGSSAQVFSVTSACSSTGPALRVCGRPSELSKAETLE